MKRKRGRRLGQGEREEQISNEGGSPGDKRAPRVRERKGVRDEFERFDERDRSRSAERQKRRVRGQKVPVVGSRTRVSSCPSTGGKYRQERGRGRSVGRSG